MPNDLEFRSVALEPAAQRRWRVADSDGEEARRLTAVVLSPEKWRPRRLALPDAVRLDLCGLVHSTRRDRARALVWGEVTASAKSYSRVFVRVDPATLREDLVACVWPGLSGIMMPVEGPEALAELDAALTSLEQAQRLPAPVRVATLLTSGVGLWAVREIIAASPHVEAVVVGVGDLAFDASETDEQAPYLTGPTPPFPSQAYL